MYRKGNFPPKYGHPLQHPSPKQIGSTDLQDSNPPYPAPENHSYSIPHGAKSFTQQLAPKLPPPPPRLAFLPQQQHYQSIATLPFPPNFIPAPPLPQFGPLSVNPSTIPIPIPDLPPPPPPPPPPSLPPPPMPPPPPAVEPNLSGEEVLHRGNLDSASFTDLEKEKAGSVSPALSDMDMEDDDVPDSSKETNQSNRVIPVEPSLVNKESNVVKEASCTSQSMIKEHVEQPLHVSQYITNELGDNADTSVNACSQKPLTQTPAARGEGFMEDGSPARSSLTPVECVIDADTNSKPLEGNTNLSPFQLLQQDYGSLDSTEDVGDPASDKEMVNTQKNVVKYNDKELDGMELKDVGNVKKLQSRSPSESPRKRTKSPLTSSFPIQQTEMSPMGPHLLHFPSGDPGPISAQDSSQQMWTRLPPPPPPPLAPNMQLVHTLHPTGDYTANLVAPYPPVEPPQTFPLPFPAHAGRWPQPSVPVSHQTSSFPSSTNTGAVVSSSTLLPSFTGSTITTRYNPYASTFESIPPPPVFSISSNMPGQGFSTDYSTKYGTAKSSAPGTLYDPLSDSIEPIQKSNPLLLPDQFSSKPATEPEVDELGEEVVGSVENVSPEPVANPGPSGTGIVTGSKERSKEDSRSMKLLKVALADYVKEVLKPAWRQGNISKDAFKTIVKKTVDKVSAAVPSHRIPKTQSKINQYVEASQQKVTKLVMSYVDKYVKKQL